MSGIVSFAEALEIVRSHAGTLHVPSTERVGLLQSAGRVLAEDILADRDQPPFDRATRDGYAVRAADWTSGRQLHLAGQIRAGESWTGGPLLEGTAIEIMTGAPVPAGADAVAMIEHAEQSAGYVSAAAGRTLQPGDNIVHRAREAALGDVVVPAGTLIGAAEIAEAATCGLPELAVRRRPAIAIVATGDELVGLADIPADHQIRNSNTYGIAAMVAAAGGSPQPLEAAPDTLSAVRDRIFRGRASSLLLLSGGVSAGRYDLVEEVLGELGAEFFFTGVRMQPGKPLVFGRLPAQQKDDTHPSPQPECYFFGLPGNPVSTQVTFHCFVEPFLRVLCGAGWSGPRLLQATLEETLSATSGLTRVLPAHLTGRLAQTSVRLVRWQGSGDLAANARANCYAVLPDGKDLKPGDIVTVLLR